MREQLLSYLKEIRLPTVRECFEEEAFRAQQESFGYERYLFELVERECEVRRNHRIDRYSGESHLPLEKNLATFEMKVLPQKVRQQVNTLLEGDFLKRRENVLAFGNPGTGKTHLLCAIGQELIRKGWRIYFTTGSLLVQELLIAKRDLKLARKLQNMAKFDAVIVDDIGYVQQEQEEMEVLFTFFAERYERGSVMITSNLAFSQWERIFKNPMMAAAAIDRLIHHSVVLELNLPSYRMSQARQRKGEEACHEPSRRMGSENIEKRHTEIKTNGDKKE